jgi:hypothetical protein
VAPPRWNLAEGAPHSTTCMQLHTVWCHLHPCVAWKQQHRGRRGNMYGKSYAQRPAEHKQTAGEPCIYHPINAATNVLKRRHDNGATVLRLGRTLSNATPFCTWRRQSGGSIPGNPAEGRDHHFWSQRAMWVQGPRSHAAYAAPSIRGLIGPLGHHMAPQRGQSTPWPGHAHCGTHKLPMRQCGEILTISCW